MVVDIYSRFENAFFSSHQSGSLITIKKYFFPIATLYCTLTVYTNGADFTYKKEEKRTISLCANWMLI